MSKSDQGGRSRITHAARDWIMRLASGDISEEELAELARWRTGVGHEEIFQHELALWRSLDAARDNLAPTQQEPATANLPADRRYRRIYTVGAIAACLAVLAATPEMLLRLRSDHRTGAAVTAFALPDGSHATLDAGTAIAVHFDKGERRIDLLRGRAWFNVQHDASKPFRVTANGAIIEDIGTAFAVSAEGNASEAAVTSGIVQVKATASSVGWARLTAGQRLSWTNGAEPRRKSDTPVGRIAAWREGDVLLDEAPVRAAIQEIARYRSGPTFILGNVDRLAPVTAIIRADRPDEGLDALASNASLQIHRFPGGIAIVRLAR